LSAIQVVNLKSITAEAFGAESEMSIVIAVLADARVSRKLSKSDVVLGSDRRLQGIRSEMTASFGDMA
jgi:hypothetical protein